MNHIILSFSKRLFSPFNNKTRVKKRLCHELKGEQSTVCELCQLHFLQKKC